MKQDEIKHKTKQKIPLMILPSGMTSGIAKRFIGLGSRLQKLFPGVKYDLMQTDLGIGGGEYFAEAIANSIFYFFLFFILLFVLLFNVQLKGLGYSIGVSFLLSFGIFVLILVILARYPKIIAGKKAEQLDRHLVFALKDLLLQITSGVTLYNSMVNISKAGYGQVSLEFEKAAKKASAGKPIDKALEEMALSSSSEFLRRSIWQLVNTLKAGASLQGALTSIIAELSAEQSTKIKDYGRELNLWSMVYMLFAVAIPTMGATLLVILASFAGAGISQGFFIAFIIITFIVQFIIIGFVKSRRPVVNI